MKNLLTAALTLALLSGCAANYPLDQSVSLTTAINVAGSSEDTYRKILGLSREKCYRLIAESQYYPEAKEGEITLVTLLNDGNIKLNWVKFEIRPIDSGSSVTVIFRKNLAAFKDVGLAWANGVPAPCPYP